MSKSQASELAKELDEVVEGFRNRPLEQGPYTCLWLDAISQRCRQGGRVVNVATVIATAVNAQGKREVLGLDVVTNEDGAGWKAFLFHAQSADQGAQERPGPGSHTGALDLRPARRQGGWGSARPGGGATSDALR